MVTSKAVSIFAQAGANPTTTTAASTAAAAAVSGAAGQALDVVGDSVHHLPVQQHHVDHLGHIWG